MAGPKIDKFRVFILILVLCALFLVNNLMHSEIYQCFSTLMPSNRQAVNSQHIQSETGDFGTGNPRVLSDGTVNDGDPHFNISRSSDIIVFLHIQKTGGTSFGQHLVNDLEYPCHCNDTYSRKCDCFKPNAPGKVWLFSKFSTGWSCGVHADWTSLNDCVPHKMRRKNKSDVKQRFFYITQLREPIARYLSEWRHVQRGATWENSRNWCGGHVITSTDIPLCYSGEDWIGVTLDEFLDCKWNKAVNRQTRMLADLSLVGCYNVSKMATDDRNKELLESAKRNLRQMAHIGLTEYQAEGQYMFEQTFGMKFVIPFNQQNETHASKSPVTDKQLDRIANINALDVELYKYAQELFDERLKSLRANE